MRGTRNLSLVISLVAAPLLILPLAVDCAAGSPDTNKTVAAARATLGAWDIDDEPFGLVPGGLCLRIYIEPDDEQLQFALNNVDVQSLIHTRRIVSFGAPSLAKLTDAGMARLRGIPGIKELSLSADSRRGFDPGFAHLKQLNQLEALEIVGDLLTDADLESFKSLTRLRVLRLGTAVNLTGTGLSFLKNLHQLESLTLNANKLEDEGLENLKQWPELLNLTLGEPWELRDRYQMNHSFNSDPAWLWVQKGLGPNIDRGMRSLEHLTNLRQLALNGVNITDIGLKSIRSFQRLETLRMAGFKLSEAGFTHLESLKNLRSLEIRDMPTPGSALEHLADLPKFDELKLVRSNITNEEAVQLGGLKKLKRLFIAKKGGGVFDETVSRAAALSAALKPMQKLEELELSEYDGIDDAVLQAIAEHKDLKTLRLAGANISNFGLRQIALLTGLQELDISRPLHKEWITDAGMKYLKGLTKLQSLKLDSTNVTDQGLAEIGGLIELRRLVLPDDISDLGIAQLGKLRHLQEVIGSRNVTTKGVMFLHDHCPQLLTAEFGAIGYVENGELNLEAAQ